jgi:sterol desaturase/sphingolipid hydroxylase (fatty acid hydroxylase superfamily)
MSIAIYFIVLAAFSFVFTLEVVAPASGARCDKRWRIYAGALSTVQVGTTLGAGILFEDLFSEAALFALPRSYSAPVVGFISFLLASFLAYWWHRAMHRFDLLWRVFHQLHHSPSRIEVLTSFYIHPFDGAAATLINACCAYLVFGASASAAAWGLLYAALNNLFIHMDRSTPYWLGAVLQRPEMHRIHHKRGFHAQNYGLPVWDLLFGTFENTRERVAICGFGGQAEHQIAEMLLMKRVDAEQARAADARKPLRG